ncbi:AAA family ATPase [Candidatus Roizmanbacteria bacterium]|nr:MAG: AAA family ATPase [Candidatus Roizmanbacteria bacterium]
MITLSSDQKQALDLILSWYKDPNKKSFITLGGYAGTGKSTLLAHLRRQLDSLDPKLKVGFVSYTGKAARVLHGKLLDEDVKYKQDTVGTIHSLIYSPVVNEKEEIIGWQQKEEIDRKLIIVDEASMVDGVIWKHLLSYKVPILAVGDHGQLPPIRGSFNLMDKPDILLEHIHRQAEKNPIIGISIQAREHGYIRPGQYGGGVVKYGEEDPDAYLEMNELLQNYSEDTLILCGYNHTRKRLNSHIRQALGFETVKPTVGDRVICLRNNHKKGIFNGMIGTIRDIQEENSDWYRAEISMDGEDEPYLGLISSKQFGHDSALNFTKERSQIMIGDLFDFGYALTVHKAQGSQARKVVLFEERFGKMNDDEWRRWLYTGVTRAEEELVIFER